MQKADRLTAINKKLEWLIRGHNILQSAPRRTPQKALIPWVPVHVSAKDIPSPMSCSGHLHEPRSSIQQFISLNPGRIMKCTEIWD